MKIRLLGLVAFALLPAQAVFSQTTTCVNRPSQPDGSGGIFTAFDCSFFHQNVYPFDLTPFMTAGGASLAENALGPGYVIWTTDGTIDGTWMDVLDFDNNILVGTGSSQVYLSWPGGPSFPTPTAGYLVLQWNPNGIQLFNADGSHTFTVYDNLTTVVGPAISSLSPSSVTAGGAGFLLTVNGSGFLGGAVVDWGSTALITTVVGAAQLTATVPAALIAKAGTFNIQAANPGGVMSAAVTYTVTVPTPSISGFSPGSVSAGGAGFVLTVNGSGFLAGAVVDWGSTALTTTFVGAAQLTATVPTALLATAGSFPIQVTNPGGATSAAVAYTVTVPTPSISGYSPTAVQAGSAGFLLTVNGAGFLNGATVYWGNTALGTTLVGATQLTATVPAVLIATSGTFTLQVANPGGVISAPVTYVVTAPGPSISGFSPPSVLAGSAGFLLTVNGSGFLNGATVIWGSTSLGTNFAGATQLTASVPASLIGTAGTFNLQVQNPGGATSAAAAYAVTTPGPAISGLSPSSVLAGTAAFPLTVNGSGFLNGATVVWGTTSLGTTFVSAAQLVASVPASLVAAAGTAGITVVGPDHVTSAPALFTVTAPAVSTSITKVENAASYASAIESGSWVSIIGTNLAPDTRIWLDSDFVGLGNNLPVSLDGVSVTINGKPAAVYYISPTQLNVQAPTDSSLGTVSVVVNNPSGTANGVATLQAYAPAFFPLSQPAGLAAGAPVYAAAVHTDKAYVVPTGYYGAGVASRAAQPGETLLIYGTGFGPTNPTAPAVQLVSGAPPLTDPSLLQILIGGVPASVTFAGLVAPGEYQFNVVVPALPNGDQPMIATINGVTSQAGIWIPIQN